MKLIKYIIIFAVLSFSVGCSKETDDMEVERNTASPTNTVNSANTVSFTNTASPANAVKTATAPAIKEKKTITSEDVYNIEEYDPDGKIMRNTFYCGDIATHTITYEYDDMGNLITQISVDEDGIQCDYKKYIYDEDGNMIQEIAGDNDIDASIERMYVYKDGLLASDRFYFSNGSTDYNEYEYNDKGELIGKKHINEENGYVYRTWEYEYDSEGNLTEMRDSMYEHLTVEHYDEAGRKILEELYYNGELSAKYEYKYNDYGLEESIRYDSDGTVSRHTRTKYNSKGLETGVYTVNEDGSEKQTSFCEYDDAGNLIHRKSGDSLLGGYEYTAEYNEYGYLTKMHNVCNDMTRDAGTYDITEEYEYKYY